MPLTTSTLKLKLKNIADQDGDNIRSFVADEALEHDDPKSFFNDLLAHGCVSGMVTSLIYYSDTHAFFDNHYDEIETIRDDLEENLGCQMPIKGDLKNYMAWLAFEETAYQLALELGVLD